MSIFAGGKNVTEVFYGTTPIAQVFYGASLVWQKRLSNIAGYEAVTAWLLKNQSVEVNGQRLWRVMEAGESFAMDVPFENEGRQVKLWALMGDEAEVSWVQDGRVCLRARVSGGQLAVESQGNRKETISYTVAWPGGRHWVMLNAENDWYGYQLGTFVDGSRVQADTNGGAVKLSERVFMPGTTRLTTSGDVAVISVDWSPYANTVTTVTNFANRVTLNSLVETVTTSGEWAEIYPGAQIRMWITSGGQGGDGGQGGQGGSASVAGADGADGAKGADGKCLEVIPPLRKGVLAVGAGGKYGNGSSGGSNTAASTTSGGKIADPGYAGQAGRATTIGGFSSDAGSSDVVPAAFGWTVARLGTGGSGGEGGAGGAVGENGSYGSQGKDGATGGLTVIYQWPKP